MFITNCAPPECMHGEWIAETSNPSSSELILLANAYQRWVVKKYYFCSFFHPKVLPYQTVLFQPLDQALLALCRCSTRETVLQPVTSSGRQPSWSRRVGSAPDWSSSSTMSKNSQAAAAREIDKHESKFTARQGSHSCAAGTVRVGRTVRTLTVAAWSGPAGEQVLRKPHLFPCVETYKHICKIVRFWPDCRDKMKAKNAVVKCFMLMYIFK